jgi:Kelch motif protein
VEGTQLSRARVRWGVAAATATLAAVIVFLALGSAPSPEPSGSPGAVLPTTSAASAAPTGPPAPAPTNNVPGPAFVWHTSRTDAELMGLASTSRGLVAVGSDQRGGVVWISADGEDWQVDDDSVTFDRVQLNGVAGNENLTLAVGCQLGTSHCAAPLAFVRGPSDKDAWERVPGNPFGDARLSSVVATSELVLVIGKSAAGRRAWLSADGRSWEAVTLPASGRRAFRITAAADQLVVVGQRFEGSAGGINPGPAVVWRSADGHTWTESTLNANGMVRGLAAKGSLLIAGGATFHAGGVARAAVWASTDGATWTDIPLRDLDGCDGPVDDVVAGDAGFLARGGCGAYVLDADGTNPRQVEWDGATTMVAGPKGFVGLGFHEFWTSEIETVHGPLDPVAGLAPRGDWVRQAPLPVLSPMTAAADDRGNMYVFTPMAKTGALRVDRYATDSSTWVRLPDVDARVGWAKAVAGAKGHIFLVGVSADGREGRTIEYDPADHTWQRLAPLPTPRTGFGLTQLHGSLYVFGGRVSPCCEGVRGDGALDLVERFDARSKTWSRAGRMPIADANPGAVTARAPINRSGSKARLKIFVFLPSRAWTFHPRTGVWKSGPASLTYGVTGSPVVGIDGVIRVFSCTRYDLFDPFHRHWQPGQNFDVDRCGAIAVAVNSMVIVLGGDYLPSPGRSVSAFFAGGG